MLLHLPLSPIWEQEALAVQQGQRLLMHPWKLSALTGRRETYFSGSWAHSLTMRGLQPIRRWAPKCISLLHVLTLCTVSKTITSHCNVNVSYTLSFCSFTLYFKLINCQCSVHRFSIHKTIQQLSQPTRKQFLNPRRQPKSTQKCDVILSGDTWWMSLHNVNGTNTAVH